MYKTRLSTLLFLHAVFLWGQECQCGLGYGYGTYGDDPDFFYEFANSKSISFCGWIPSPSLDSSFHASDFSVFTCAEKDLLASYSAIQSCLVTIKNDTVSLDRRINLYNGPGRKWKAYTFSQRQIILKNDTIEITEEKVILSLPDLNLVDAEEVLSTDFKRMNKNYDQLSDFLGQLEILALHQHKEAVKLLFSKELEDATNAASTQDLYLIRASFNWFVHGIKDEEQWL